MISCRRNLRQNSWNERIFKLSVPTFIYIDASSLSLFKLTSKFGDDHQQKYQFLKKWPGVHFVDFYSLTIRDVLNLVAVHHISTCTNENIATGYGLQLAFSSKRSQPI